MDRLWKGHEFQPHQLADFTFHREPNKEDAVLLATQAASGSDTDAGDDGPAWPPASVVQFAPVAEQLEYAMTEHSREVQGKSAWAEALKRVISSSHRPLVLPTKR